MFCFLQIFAEFYAEAADDSARICGLISVYLRELKVQEISLAITVVRDKF